MSQINTKKSTNFSPPPPGFLGYGFDSLGNPGRVNSDGSFSIIPLTTEGGIAPNILANRGVGPAVDLPSSFVQGDTYVSDDTYKVFVANDDISWNSDDLISSQFVTDNLSLYQFDGTDLLLLASLLGLTDVFIGSYAGKAGQLVKVNDIETGIDSSDNLPELIGFEKGIRVDPNQTLSPANGATFGIGNSIIYEVSDGILITRINGVDTSRVDPLFIGGAIPTSGGFKNQAASNINPTLTPRKNDIDTGVGSAGANILTLIAGGTECVRIEAGVQKFNGQAIGGDGTKTFATTPEFDFDDGNTQQITLTANITSWTIANELPAGQYTIYFIQDGTGGWTIPDPTGIDREVNESIAAFDLTADAINIVNVFVMPDGTSLWSLVGSS